MNKIKAAPLIGLFFASFICVGCSPSQDQLVTNANPQTMKFSPLYLYQNTEEVENFPLTTTGKIPPWLEGEFVRNGPAIVRDQRGNPIKSWFDGLAKLHAFTFRQGKVAYTCKFLRSNAFETYRATGEFDFAGFAQRPKTSQFSVIDFIFGLKNKEITNANVNIAKINNTLIALTEMPLPVVFDGNLNTLGYFDYADSLPKNYRGLS